MLRDITPADRDTTLEAHHAEVVEHATDTIEKIYHARAVRAHERHVAGGPLQSLFEPRALLPGFGKSGRVDDGGTHARSGQIRDRIDRGADRNSHEGEINRSIDIGSAAVTDQVTQAIAGRVDDVDAAVETEPTIVFDRRLHGGATDKDDVLRL